MFYDPGIAAMVLAHNSLMAEDTWKKYSGTHKPIEGDALNRDMDILIPPYPREHSRYFAEGVVIGVLIALCVAMVPAVIFGVFQ